MDYQRIFESDFGIQKIKYRGNQGTGLCPFHDDRNPSLSWSLDTGLWTCFSGCGSGNTYQLAERLNLPNPRQYIDNPYEDSKISENGEYQLNSTLKSENKQVTQDENMEKINVLKERYRNQVNKVLPIVAKWKHKYMGKDDDGRSVWIYEQAIKHHKSKDGKPPWWEGQKDRDGNVIGSHCQIFMVEEMSSFDKSKPLYIFEGEKDELISPLQGISFSGGCQSIPDDITPLYEFPKIIIIYDNDDAGRKGSVKLAERIKAESPSTIVRIAKWDESLPDGYDVFDDTPNEFSQVGKAIGNATEYTIPIPKQLKGFTIMTGKEASNATPKPTEWIVEGVLPKQFNSCIAGTTGSKKSMWAIQLALSVANGEKEFCGNKIKTSGIKALYIDTEIGEDELLRRFHRIKAHMDWKGNDNWMMMSKGGTTMDIWEQTEEMIQAWRPELIVIDSMYNATSVSDFSKPTGMSKVTTALSILKDRYGITILLVAHFNKSGHEFGLIIDRMQGSAVFQNWIEFQILMIRTNEQDLNIWQVAKTRGVFHDESYVGLKWDDFWFTSEGVIEDIKPYLITDEKKNKWQSILEDCPEKFDTNQWLNVFNVKYPEMSKRTAKTWLKEASGTPMLKKISHGLYQKHLKLIVGVN